jgi:hypothetical protein
MKPLSPIGAAFQDVPGEIERTRDQDAAGGVISGDVFNGGVDIHLSRGVEARQLRFYAAQHIGAGMGLRFAGNVDEGDGRKMVLQNLYKACRILAFHHAEDEVKFFIVGLRPLFRLLVKGMGSVFVVAAIEPELPSRLLIQILL